MSVDLEPRGGRLVMTSLAIVQDPMYSNQNAEVTSALLRSISVLGIVRAALNDITNETLRADNVDIAQFLRDHQDQSMRDFGDQWTGATHTARTAGVGRKPKFSTDELRGIAVAAIAAHNRGDTGIHAELIKAFPMKLANKQQARDAVRRARKEGFLAAAPQGRIDFQEGPKLHNTSEVQQ